MSNNWSVITADQEAEIAKLKERIVELEQENKELNERMVVENWYVKDRKERGLL